MGVNLKKTDTVISKILVFPNLLAILCVAIAGILMILDKDGWGWLLFLAFLIYQHRPDEDNDDFD